MVKEYHILSKKKKSRTIKKGKIKQMALVECPECGKEVSTTASNCPNCGYSIKRIVEYCVACELNKNKMVLMHYDKKQDMMICPECGHTLRFTSPEEEVQIEQSRRLYEMQNSNKPKCPTCQSINIKKISSLSKASSMAMFGIFSQKVKHQFKCNNCGYEW